MHIPLPFRVSSVKPFPQKKENETKGKSHKVFWTRAYTDRTLKNQPNEMGMTPLSSLQIVLFCHGTMHTTKLPTYRLAYS